MNLDHMHLGSKDLAKTRAFYETYLDFRFHFEIDKDFIFLTNDAKFVLAITKETPAKFPEWFHVGFKQPDAATVRRIYSRMKADGLAVDDLLERPKRVAFGLADPDGLGVEVYWEA